MIGSLATTSAGRPRTTCEPDKSAEVHEPAKTLETEFINIVNPIPNSNDE
jgi:hypothetical protein